MSLKSSLARSNASNPTRHKSSATAESLEEYKALIQDATDDLQTRLESIDDKLNSVIAPTATTSNPDAAELRIIKEERLSTQKCLQICEQLSHHINQMQLIARHDVSSQGGIDTNTVSQQLTDQALDACKENLVNTTRKLENHMKDLTNRLMTKFQAAAASPDEIAEIARLQDQWEAARQCMEICSTADDHLKENVSIIENWATGDAVQFMVSTNGKLLRGKNRGTGWRTRQVGGSLSDATVLQLSRDMSTTSLRNKDHDDRPEQDICSACPNDRTDNGTGANFKERYGQGVRLAPEFSLDSGAASAGSSADDRHILPKR